MFSKALAVGACKLRRGIRGLLEEPGRTVGTWKRWGAVRRMLTRVGCNAPCMVVARLPCKA